ncbi:hypothetical protein GCM10010411_75910 [Actinomadura fulvescens]|uniref:DUF6545 domain-containing protein n=1 Tax=Actinomadura fulvescens TaxID=46160 RepID=A0ABN3QJD3_9ACTN
MTASLLKYTPPLGPILFCRAAFGISLRWRHEPLARWTRPVAEPLRLALAYRRLGPLWRALHDAFPQTHLDNPSHRPSVLLLRRAVEIRDGQQQLQPYLSCAAICTVLETATVMELSGEDLDAAVEAALISAALVCRRAGISPRASAEPPSPIGDIAQEIESLERVARAFVSSPLVKAMPRAMAQHIDR